MKRITSDKLVADYDRNNTVNLRAEPGEKIVVETHDRFSSLLGATGSPNLSNPALMGVTGAIYVEGAMPGMTLKVEILNMELTADYGLVMSIPGKGSFADAVKEFTMVKANVVGDEVRFLDYRLPLRPMVGRIGVAPAGDPVPSVSPGAHGGNLDVTDIAPGASVLLPVLVEGGLLAIGDLHALMGDGEVNIGAVETMGNVTIRCSLLDDWPVTHPMVITPTHLVALGSAPTLDEASIIALRSMRDHLVRRYGLNPVHAGMLLSIGSNLAAGQIVNPLKTAKVAVPHSLLGQL